MTPISEIKTDEQKILQPYQYVSNPSVMGSSNTNVPLYPSLASGPEGKEGQGEIFSG